MYSFSRIALPFVLVVVASCGRMIGRFVPNDVKGDTPIVVANTDSDELCWFMVAPPTASDLEGYNFMKSLMTGPKPLPASEQATFNVKPGMYLVHAETCHHDFKFEQRVTIAGPTYFALGHSALKAPAGYAVVRAAGRTQQACGDPGELATPGSIPCCSHQHHFDPGQKLEICD